MKNKLDQLLPDKKNEKNNGFGLFDSVKARGNDVDAAKSENSKWRTKIARLFSKETVIKLQDDGKTILSLLSFFGLVLLFLGDLVIRAIGLIPGIKQLVTLIGNKTGNHAWRLSEAVINKFENRPGRIRRSVLISLAFRNMRVKRTRAIVTVGGMGMGIAAIVFLVSLGYGVQRLVVSRVARLDELRMADVTMQNSSNLKLDNSAIENMLHMPGVEKVMPMVSLVGKLSFSGGVGESLVYGVSKDYLEAAGIKPTKGEYFESSDKQALNLMQGVVAGANDNDIYDNPGRIYSLIREGRYNAPSVMTAVYQEPWENSVKLGYTREIDGGLWGEEIWGEKYTGTKGDYEITLNGERRGVWLRTSYPIWVKKDGSWVPKLNDGGAQVWQKGYIEMDQVTRQGDGGTLDLRLGEVLGESSDTQPYTVLGEEDTLPVATLSANVVGVDEDGVEWVDLSSLDSSASANVDILEISLPENAKKQALINAAFMDLVGIDKNDPVGKSFEVSFVILNTLKPGLDRPTQSSREKYVVSGVIDEGSSPQMYVPIEDLTGLGITNFSQAKVVAQKQDELGTIRQQIDNLGYKTNSVADTVAQIDKLFGTVRVVLASFGLVALTVASLGMFNTLTVSLMERTREVGVMKAMGMRSVEVKELFLAEAMIMGLLGGVFGVLGGWLAGKSLGLLLSTVSLAKGVGMIDVSFIPWQFVVFIISLSFIVGVATGVYPAKRARKISALNALRYE